MMHPPIALELPGAGLLLDSATDQAEALAGGRIGAHEFLQLQRAAIEALNPAINAYVQVAPPGDVGFSGSSLLSGSTFAVKDNIDAAGFASHAGLLALEAPISTRDAEVVARLKRAGLAFLGKQNMHAMALGATNQNDDFGNCRNPYRLTHTPGGSSGGSAASVAAGMCGIALGTDTMGSVRVPAAYCGVVGFKPSFDALPTDGMTMLCSLLDHIGILARRVEDVAAAFGILAGHPWRDAAPHARPDLPTRFGVPSDLAALGATDDVRDAFQAGVDRLRRADFVLDPVDISTLCLPKARRAGLLLCEAELHGTLGQALQLRRERVPKDLLVMLDFAAGKDAIRLAQALRTVVRAGQSLSRLTSSCDMMLLPTTPQAAFGMDAAVPANQADFTALANMNGAPAISLPLPVDAGALPIGMQLIGRRGFDGELLRAALQVQQALDGTGPA
jgi:aspartyl-tRNA(Asn)/glutamyl-tRNA(Gln) amidotransferase subunit A